MKGSPRHGSVMECRLDRDLKRGRACRYACAFDIACPWFLCSALASPTPLAMGRVRRAALAASLRRPRPTLGRPEIPAARELFAEAGPDAFAVPAPRTDRLCGNLF